MKAEHSEHILPLRTYLLIAVALFILTGLTVGISYVHLGPWNAVVALGVAGLKASLVALFFMHLKYDNKLYMFVFLAAIFFVMVFIVITMFDTLRRADIYEIRGAPINKDAIIYDREPTHTESNH